MPTFLIEQRFIELEKLVILAEQKNLDPQTQSYFCKLGSVLICGNLERSVEYLVTERIAVRSPPQVKSFLKTFFKRGTNYDCDQIAQLFYKFDSAWGSHFENFIGGNDRIKESVSSCYGVRNSVAHGGGHSLGHKALRQYFDDTFALVVEMEAMLR